MVHPSAKRRKLATKVEEINFDTDARQEYLTGFRKRKLQRQRHAQEIAERKAKEIKRDERRKIREQRAEDYQRAFEEHRRQLKRLKEEEDGDGSGSASDDDDEEGEEWGGIEEPPPVDYEAEYIDEDKYTTVTVEEMDPSREGLLNYHGEDRSDEEKEGGDARATKTEEAPEPTKKKKAQDKPKKKKKKFRYESKEDRRLTRTKQRLSNQKKAKARREQ
ncbi:rRNA-processing protein RRP17 [Aspergillus candidus]|uniref:Nucleolar protein 12-domain-containing protein n=1 Tax=Aspergillus candidus TaxID=41067 RepID=A0A2I2F7Q2_ASPCN|nr:nucleolar protein 12-domain-containing protein [Aspergillus candidus]PLB36655.1 nucleolar protein 12-domain-containing protein [Aspergillus candidus]